ncbi:MULTISPECIES: DUF397 domain-containing protein [Streptomyces]|jgi:hypothetical protein|uniref:DUF397 domain-containing protein n=1 Tax=Streptomyces TaxID=1883 RepID=UPI0004E6FA51|nr:DUF397 domain-containing protein [Streptomyces scabiei]KFG00093.1 hypothetical protein IQ62_15865 [Streptomyces scabiei]
MPTLHWQKSSYSSEGNNCLELATTPDGAIHLRESDDPTVALTFQPRELTALLHTTRQGISPHGTRPLTAS